MQIWWMWSGRMQADVCGHMSSYFSQKYETSSGECLRLKYAPPPPPGREKKNNVYLLWPSWSFSDRPHTSHPRLVNTAWKHWANKLSEFPRFAGFCEKGKGEELLHLQLWGKYLQNLWKKAALNLNVTPPAVSDSFLRTDCTLMRLIDRNFNRLGVGS